ncbi:MAG: DNA-directed polymerase subunit alpha [Planctomycetota bacterium]|jgi:DNA-directed RNA polymerase subunit alpha
MPRIPYKNLTQSDEMAEKLEMSTAEIGLSVRTTNCLEEKGIFTVHDLLNCTRADLLSISNFGEKTLEEVYRALEKIGFYRSSPADTAAVSAPRSLRGAGDEVTERTLQRDESHRNESHREEACVRP